VPLPPADARCPVDPPALVADRGATLQPAGGCAAVIENDARWAERGWVDIDVRTSKAHAITLRQDGATLRAWLDGVELPGHALATTPAPGRLSIGLKGGPGDRARMWLDRVALRRD
jgi:hypothetical protein